MKKIVVIVGIIAVTGITVWHVLGTKPTAEERRELSSREKEEHRSRPADQAHHQKDASGQPAAAAVIERTAMDGKIVLLEGEVGPQGSTGPVKVKRSDGAIISSSKLDIREDGSGLLAPPVEIHLPSGLVAVMEEKGMLVAKEGGYKALGSFKVTHPPTNAAPKADTAPQQ